jgi:hypothetical protein
MHVRLRGQRYIYCFLCALAYSLLHGGVVQTRVSHTVQMLLHKFLSLGNQSMAEGSDGRHAFYAAPRLTFGHPPTQY